MGSLGQTCNWPKGFFEAQCLKCRTPVKTIAMSRASSAAISSAYRIRPQKWNVATLADLLESFLLLLLGLRDRLLGGLGEVLLRLGERLGVRLVQWALR